MAVAFIKFFHDNLDRLKVTEGMQNDFDQFKFNF